MMQPMKSWFEIRIVAGDLPRQLPFIDAQHLPRSPGSTLTVWSMISHFLLEDFSQIFPF